MLLRIVVLSSSVVFVPCEQNEKRQLLQSIQRCKIGYCGNVVRNYSCLKEDIIQGFVNGRRLVAGQRSYGLTIMHSSGKLLCRLPLSVLLTLTSLRRFFALCKL